jgi:hypothetical protein
LEPPHEATRSSARWWSSQEVLEMIALKELKAARHSLHQNVEALRGRTIKLYQDNQGVCGALRKMSSKCPALMAEIKDLVPWLHENKIRLDVVYIRSEANFADAPSRQQRGLDMYVVLAAGLGARAFAPGRVDIGLAGLQILSRYCS